MKALKIWNDILLRCLMSLLFLSPFLVCSQTVEELKQQVYKSFDEGHIDQSVLIAEKVAAIEQPANDKEYLSWLNILAYLYKKNNNAGKAEKTFLLAIDLHKKLNGENNTEYAELLNRLGVLYDENGKYNQGMPLLQSALNIHNKLSGENDSTYITYATNLASIYTGMAKYDTAEALLLKIIDTQKKIGGDDNLDYAILLNLLARVYVLKAEYIKAEPFYVKVLELRKKLSGENNLDYASILNNLGALYFRIGKYQQAENYYNQAIQISETINNSNRDYANFCNNLATLFKTLGQYQKAETFYLKSLGILKHLFGEEHPQYLLTLNNLAAIYETMGQYQKAEKMYLQCIDVNKKNLGELHPDYATNIEDLASLYEEMGEYKKSEALLLKAQKIIRSSLGEDHPEYALILFNLGLFYESLSEYSKAESFLVKAADIRKKKFGEDHEEFGASINSLGSFYRILGQTDKAENFYLQALKIYKNIFGKDNPRYAEVLNNLGILYESIGEYVDAEKIDLESLEIRKKFFGEANPSYAVALNNLAALYESMGKTDTAESLYIKVCELRKTLLGETHPDYATSINNLGHYYSLAGKYDKAEPLLLQSLQINKDRLGMASNDYSMSLRNLGAMYMHMKRYGKADSFLLSSVKTDLLNLFSSFSIMSEKEKELYINKRYYISEQLNSFLFINPASVDLAKNNYNMQLVLKSLSLADTRNMLSSIQDSKDQTIKKTFDKWKNNKAFLSKQYSLPPDKRFERLDSLESITESLEKQLNNQSFAFRNQNALLKITYWDVRKKLAENEAAIEFVRFNYFDNRWTDTVIYAAYLLRKYDSFPVFIPLCREAQLVQLFSGAGRTTAVTVNNFYRGVGSEEDTISLSKGDSLYKFIWQPLEPFLKGINKINYSPAGKLYTISFNALPAGNGKLLMDKYDLQQYTSTRQIALRINDTRTSAPKNIALFGNATFSLDSLQLIKNLHSQHKSSATSVNFYTPKNRGSNNAVWSSLPGTADEVNRIKKLFIKNKTPAISFIQLAASEENFKNFSGHSPYVIHLATHGFFLTEADKKRKESNIGNVYSLADNPLMRSGILLSGANYAWSGRLPINNVEDGIATAYEISQLDLAKTELVVLSACETALGDIKGSEGVFGLQRAFKMAGVKKLIVSLWQVPDKETAELMTLFYSDWLKGNTIEHSFYQAQSEMRKKYSPFYWAAFILVE